MRISINFEYQTLILFLLWISGVTKIFVTTYIAEIDIVLLALLIALIDILFIVSKGMTKFSSSYILAFVALLFFYLYATISLTYSSSANYGLIKVINFVPNILFFAYAGAIKKVNWQKFTLYYCYVLIPLAVFFIYMKSIVWIEKSESVQIFKTIRNHYLSIGIHLGILFFLVHNTIKRKNLQIFLLFLLFASSARAAFLFTILVLLFFEINFIKRIKLKKKAIYIALGVLSSLLFAGIFFSDLVHKLSANAINRFKVLFSGGGVSTNERLEAMAFALEHSFLNTKVFLFGHGMGSFGYEFSGIDARQYPHNLFLEILFELGFLGLLFFTFLSLIALKGMLKNNKLLLMLTTFLLLNVMKSSNLTDLWILFSLFGILLNRKQIKFVYE